MDFSVDDLLLAWLFCGWCDLGFVGFGDGFVVLRWVCCWFGLVFGLLLRGLLFVVCLFVILARVLGFVVIVVVYVSVCCLWWLDYGCFGLRWFVLCAVIDCFPGGCCGRVTRCGLVFGFLYLVLLVCCLYVRCCWCV